MINTVLTNMDMMKKDSITMASIFTGLIDGGSINMEMMPASRFATKTVLIEMAMIKRDMTNVDTIEKDMTEMVLILMVIARRDMTEMVLIKTDMTGRALIAKVMTETDITGKAVTGFNARAKKLRKKPKKKLHGRKNRMMPLIDGKKNSMKKTSILWTIMLTMSVLPMDMMKTMN